MQGLTVKRDTTLWIMFAACLAVFLTALDQTVVVTALPQIITDLSISPLNLDHAAWIVSGYLLGYVIVMPLMGRVSDLFGRRRVFVICLLVFALGSLGCGLAPWLGQTFTVSWLQTFGIDISSPGLIWLVAARFIQAAGGGAMIPVAMAVTGDYYGSARRAVILGLIGMITEAGGALGPLYGSLIIQLWHWQAIFYLNLPLVAILIFFIVRFIPAPAPSDARPHGRIDLTGSLLLGASLTCLSLGLAQEAAQITPTTIAPDAPAIQNNPWFIAAALVLLALFIALELSSERRKGWPTIELSLFKRPTLTASALTSFLVGAALIVAMVDIPIFFITVLNRSSLEGGLALLRLTALIPVGALLGGWLSSRLGCRWTAVLGLLATVSGFWLMSRWPADVSELQVTISTVITGFGLGLVIAPISTSAINAVNSRQLGMASSLVTMLRMIGMILGLAALTSWGLGRFRAQAATFKPPAGISLLSAQYAHAYGNFLLITAHDIYTQIFLAAGIICLVALLPAFFLQGRKPAATVVRSSGRDVPLSTVNTYSEQESEAGTTYGQREI